MEILQKFKQNGYFTAELYHLIAKKKLLATTEEITPSQYEKEMRMSTLQRLQTLNGIEVDNMVKTGSKGRVPVLSFTPSVIVFQNFKPNDKIVAKFSVKNISRSPSYLNMVYKESSFFSVKPCSGQLLSRLAPGISVTFAVTFTPIQYEDYTHRVTFYTDVDQYILAFIAMGPRPVFDFPDQIIIPKVPLKVENTYLMTVHNIGAIPAGFTLQTKSPFKVQPKSAYLVPDQKIQIKVGFKTMHLGETSGVLYAILETGEHFSIKLSGTTHTVNIELEKAVVRFSDTYNTMVRQQAFKITNKSDHVISFMCMKNECIYYDFQEKVKLATIFYNVKDSESAKYTKLVRYDVLSSDEHERVYTRIFFDEIQALVADESLRFQDTHFSITPISGNLWPNKCTEIVITFSPKQIGEFDATAYLDIDGLFDRVPLKMLGNSLPPCIQLNLETLDMDCVYINKMYNYEVVAVNKGHINGVIVYKEVPTLFGSNIKCSPEMHCLRPGEREIFIISFSNSSQGPYFEEINFIIRDTNVVLKLYLKGEVVYPSLCFSMPCLDFGKVSVGVPKTLEVEVINESVVNVNASVKISSDGPEVSSMTLADYAVADSPKPCIPQWPREFNIEPCRIEMGPESRVTLMVTLTANLVRANQTSLELELEKSDSPPIILPVMFDAKVPDITPAPDIKLRACFLDFPYPNDIHLTVNDIWGYFTLEEPEEESTLDVTVGVKEGIIQPNSTFTLPVTIKTSVLGVQEYSIRLRLFGMSKPIEVCHITGTGVRPIVTCTPIALHWGQVKLLTKTYKILTLCNDSPVYVNFKASLLNKDGRWNIDPTEGYVEPESETDLIVSLYLIDADSYTNKAVLQLEKVKDILVPLSATGVGTSILVGELRDRIFLGRHFTKIPLNATVVMENCGTRLHSLEWSEHYKAPKTKPITSGFFNLDPRLFKIAAGEKLDLSIMGLSHKVTTIKEMWYLVGSVEGINKKELLLECQITAEFVDPKIEVSSTMVEFQYDYGPYSEYYKLTDIITIKNVSKLPLDIDLCVKPPFAIVQKQDTYKIPPEEEHLCCCICYKEGDLNIPNMHNEVGPYESRLFIDYLTMSPVEPTRKEPLHFFQDIHKIKMAFNLTHSIEERLEDQETMKVQILFDTTKHLSLKSKIYSDLMKIKFRGHKNKDAMKLIGKINFPNIFVMLPKVDFQSILNDSIESKTIQLQNLTPLLACYRFQWKKSIITTEKDKTEDSYKITSKFCGKLGSKSTDTISPDKSMHVDLALDSESKCAGSKKDFKAIRTRVMTKVLPMINVKPESPFEWICKFEKLRKFHETSINDVFQLTPHRGLLKPNEIQHIHVIFTPKRNISVRATLECEVLGGPPELIAVFGQSADLLYKINTHKLNFKIRSFHEPASEQLIVTNISRLPFEYKTYLNEPKFTNDLQGTILDVVPQNKMLEPEEVAEMEVVMRPGVVGYFTRVFVLEIGHLPHIPITIFGWGVIPQVYMSLHRPDIVHLNPEFGYMAIPALTDQYMSAIKEFFASHKVDKSNDLMEANVFKDDPDLQNDWHICSWRDNYPSVMDIELAIERMLVIEHIKIRPELLLVYSNSNKMGPIPGFHTTPYVIDYGVVITGSTVQSIAEIINYGPIPTKIHFAKGTHIPSWLTVKICGKLNPGETGKLEVGFMPNSTDFTELEQNVETYFNLEVPYGVTMPVHIKALCAVPYLMSNVSMINFGSVRCGDKIITSIPLKNVGKPTCIWYVTLRLKAPGPNPMLILDSSGKYEPGEGGWLSIAFKPTMEMMYEGMLIFRFHMNPNRMTIPVIGQGIVPQVHVIGPSLSFPPTLPWAETTEMYFGLMNPCPFPIELIIAHTDEKWKEEEEIYQLLNKYYNKPEEMLVPAVKPGDDLPAEIVGFYRKFTATVAKTKEEEAAALKATTTKSTAVAAKKAKSPKNAPKVTGSPKVSPKKFRTEAEIIVDEIRTLKENGVDPLKECLHAFDRISSGSVMEKHSKGLLVFVHGSPCEEVQCQEMAYSIGKELKIPTVNIDNCIVEALCECTGAAKILILSTINELYQISRSQAMAKGDPEIVGVENEEVDLIDENEDQFQVIQKKIEYLANNKNVGTPRSKTSDKKKKRSPTSSVGSHIALGGLGSTTLFNMDLTQELLMEYFSQPKFSRGLVIDSLKSIVLKSPSITLTLVLKCKSNIRNIHLILCQSDFNKWAQAYEESIKEVDPVDEVNTKVYDEAEIQQIVGAFEEMDENDFKNSSPELRAIYITHGLEARRKKYFDKIGYQYDVTKKEKENSKSVLNMDTSDSKKKIKKEDNKGAKATAEYTAMNARYNEYTKITYEQLINIANNWIIDECEMGIPLIGFNGQVLGAAQKKAKKKSELQLQFSDVSYSDRGFPLTLITCPCLNYKMALVKSLANSLVVKEALEEEEEEDILLSPERRKEFTVLLPRTFPHINHEKPLKWRYLHESPLKKCECNQLTDLNLLDDSTQENVVNIISKWHCVCGKKMASSQTSTSEVPVPSLDKVSEEGGEGEDDILYPLPLRSVQSVSTTGGRLVLHPGDLVRCKYTFSPQIEGHFSVKRFVEVNGWPNSRVDINVSGICDLPRLDSRPKKMFENFVRRTVEDNVYKLTFLDDLKLFEFGPIFIGSNRIYEEEYKIDLKNSSLIRAEIYIEFLDDTTVFQIDKNFIRLEPGCRGKLTLSAAPAEVGVHNVVLLFCIKDNPEIVAVNIACSGVVPIVEILPITKSIEYGKLLLYRREDDRFIVKNDSILPIMWKIRNAVDFISDFIIASTSGIVPRHNNHVVPVTYIACNVGIISNKTLTIDIYDAEGRGSPMITENLSLSAECYDVMVECAYENPTEMFLNYGNVKVNSTVIREMYLLNRGKYNIYFKLKKVKNFPEPSLLRSFEAIPESGMIPASLKLVSIDFECTPTTSMNLSNVPAYICTLLDGSKNQVVVAKFPICVTIASFYNTFTLFPLGELNFHIIAVGSGVIRDVIINNTSKCPVTYDIVLPEKYRIDPMEQQPVKLKDNKLKVPPLKCGNFTILNDDNLLAPGTSRTLQIQFSATAARMYEETINFIISDTCPAEAQGVPLRLVGTGAMPTLDFWNLETTFREHLIVKNLSEYKVPESSPHCVFVEDSVTLHFFCVTVNTSYTAAIDLYNNGLVACALSMKLHYQTNSNQEIFYLDKYETHIEPLLHKTLGVIFNPKELQEYRAVLDIRLKLLDNQEQSFKICLIGEGVIPRIQMVSPPKRHNVHLLKFPVTCLGSLSNNVIRFKNVSSAKSTVVAKVYQLPYDSRPIFWLSTTPDTDHMVISSNNAEYSTIMKILLSPREIATLKVFYSPISKGRSSCDVKLNIVNNAYEHFEVSCEGEAFVEDVIIIGLEMLPMDTDLDAYRSSVDGTMSTVSTVDSRKKSKSAPLVKRKSKQAMESKRSRRTMASNSMSLESNDLKYILDFGGCELSVMEKRNIIMINNSDKVYKFEWQEVDHICVKPSVGYILPGEEKDMEIMFISTQLVSIKRNLLHCALTAVSYDALTFHFKTTSWDNRQIVTVFNHDKDMSLNERRVSMIEEQNTLQPEDMLGVLRIIIVYSAVTEFCKYTCSLPDEKSLKDTFVYQTRPFTFTMKNIGNVPMKTTWSFGIDDEFPTRLDKCSKQKRKLSNHDETIATNEKGGDESMGTERNSPNEEGEEKEENEDDDAEASPEIPTVEQNVEKVASKVTLFSGSTGRDSVDTWFEIDLPFQIEPDKVCLKPNQSQTFTVTFAPQDAFYYQVRLKSLIDNLDPYDQNVFCKITAKSLIPYCHLDMPESDYLTSGRRKITGGVALPKHISVLEFNVLGSGCYKKSFHVVNPTSEAYEFIFEMVLQDKPELIPVHCDTLKGYVEGGTSTEVTFTFSPTAPGVYESQWKFMIPVYTLTMHLLVVGLVREPDVVFIPTILVIRNSLVGFTVTNVVKMKNNEDEGLKFEFKGNSLCNESGKTPVVMEPEHGILKPHSETPIKISYTPIEDGPLSFKIFCSVCYMVKYLTLCVNALSYSINPKISYYLIGNEHVLRSDFITNIHLDQTASTYQRTIPFKIHNDGSATFFFDWSYNCSRVKKYLTVDIDPQSGHVAPGNETECTLYFTLIQVPVQAFPVTLNISDGPEYTIYLHADIKKPLYHFTCMDIDFGKCIVNAPDATYKKNLAFVNDDTVPVIFSMNFATIPELFVDFQELPDIPPGRRIKIPVYFRPKQVKEYEFKLEFWVNSLCQEIISVKGEGIPLLFDLYEGCQKSFNLGPVKVGDKIIRPIEVMNHSKVPIDATFIFRDMYPVIEDTTQSEATSVCLSPSATTQADGGPSRVKMLQTYKDDKIREQIAMDIQNALSSLKVIPNKCKILPYRKFPLKIQFKPNGMISDLNVQLNMKVFEFERPLVRISGSATGMSLCFSQNSLQFGRVRKRGCKILKVMLMNKGDFGTRFCWQPLISDEFTICPMQGSIAAHTNVTFTISFRPLNHNPFIKVWASCNLDNYMPLELAMYATCVDLGNFQNKVLYLECPVREVITEYLTVTNSSDDVWLVLSEFSEPGPFETLREFNIEPNSTFEIPVTFKPKTIGKHECQVLFSPLGESALFVNLVGVSQHPNPNGNISVTVPAKEFHTEELVVYNITEFPETYVVSTEIMKLVPDKFEGRFEIVHPETIKVWGEAAAICRLKYVCYEECEMQLKVLFINEDTREYQFYNLTMLVTASPLVDTLTFVARAREIFRKELTVTNPLSEESTFSVKCERLNCPESIKIGRNSEAALVLTYNPLVVGESEDYLEINNTLVGTYMYKVVLKCLPAKEKNLEYQTELGNCISLRLRVQNNTDIRTDFITTTTHPCILAEPSYSLLPFEKGKFLVWFEPTHLGVQNCRLSFESPVAGEFVFNIKGKAVEPKPQGPFEIRAGGFALVRFKNVFDDVRMFKIYVDRDEFYVKTVYETIKSKKDIKIPVYLNETPSQGWSKDPTGCLIVECYDPPEPKVNWTYFLQGKS
ncbi:hydrocephalus-inducing protein homolog isoform X2 [Plodia interpunctella]|uniref:hydrocephalus-inducing protein homolog isoform X2 n=1 Tax=Plodia interpunctella TaxID=58824 RepID=UPI002368434D|nr:hydrocephalus-inducing protein homolog isoform X2 [Plodia interpunctella]